MNESQKDFLLIVGLFGLGIVGVLFFMIRTGASPFRGDRVVAENHDTESQQPASRQPAEVREPAYAPLAEPEQRPAEPSIPVAPTSPGVVFGFDDIEQACGDLSSSFSSYLCLVNQGNEPVAGGARLVLDEGLASFTGQGTYNNGISIRIEGEERYSLDFGPPKGKPLLPGLYTGATRWPFNAGPYPGIYVSIGSTSRNIEDGQFRILQIQLSGDKVRRFVADFETSRNGAIGRVALGQLTESRSLSQPLR